MPPSTPRSRLASAVNPLAGNLDVDVPNTNPNTNGTFIAYLDNWTVEEETFGAYTQFDFRLRRPSSADLGKHRCPLCRD